MTKECGLVECRSTEPHKSLVDVTDKGRHYEHTAACCGECLKVLGIKPGDTLPDDTNATLRKHFGTVPGDDWRDPEKPGEPKQTAGRKRLANAGDTDKEAKAPPRRKSPPKKKAAPKAKAKAKAKPKAKAPAKPKADKAPKAEE